MIQVSNKCPKCNNEYTVLRTVSNRTYHCPICAEDFNPYEVALGRALRLLERYESFGITLSKALERAVQDGGPRHYSDFIDEFKNLRELATKQNLSF